MKNKHQHLAIARPVLAFLLILLLCFGAYAEVETAGPMQTSAQSAQPGASEPPPADESQPTATPEAVSPSVTSAQPTATPTAEPAVATAEENADKQVNALLAQIAGETTNAWQKAIYEMGAQGVMLEGDIVLFSMRTFNPILSAVDKQLTGRDALRAMSDNAAYFDMTVGLILKDGAFTEKSVKALQKTVVKAATASEKAYGQKAFKTALVQWLLPAPVAKPSGVKKAEDLANLTPAFREWVESTNSSTFGKPAERWAPLFYGQTKQTVSVKGGPHAITVTCKGISPEQLLEKARTDLFAKLSKQAKACWMTYDEVETALIGKLAEAAISLRKKAKDTFTLTLDLDFYLALKRFPDGYQDYMNRYTFSDVAEALYADVEKLPVYPALDYPKTGVLSGSNSGTRIIVKAPKDGIGRYVQLRKYDTDELAVAFFLNPGGSYTARAPKGDYYFLVASGETWYGEEELFGDAGDYSRTGLFNVLSTNYYHIVTLGLTSEGNMSVWGDGKDSFQK